MCQRISPCDGALPRSTASIGLFSASSPSKMLALPEAIAEIAEAILLTRNQMKERA